MAAANIFLCAGVRAAVVGVRPGGRPQNLAFDSKLFQNLARLSEIPLHLRPGSSNFPLVIRIFTVLPGFRKVPGRMVQDQAGDGKQPQEEEQEQAGVIMQLAVPALQPDPQAGGGRWVGGGGRFSG